MNPSHSPGASSPGLPHRHKGISKPLAVLLGKVGVAIVDDEQIVHEFLKTILDQSGQFAWVGSYTSGEAALTGIPQSGAQVVLMDIRMPGMDGIECARRLKSLLPHLIIVMITGLDDPRTIELVKECGANDFLLKPFSAGQVLASLSFFVPRPKAEGAAQQPSGTSAPIRGLRGRPLTAHENRLMKFMAEGCPYKEIAEKTGVSESAVHHMVTHIFRKLGVTNKTAAIRKWQNGNRRSP